MTKRSQPKSTKAEKIAWLLAHESLWRGFPSRWLKMGTRHWYLADEMVKRMKAEGLVSKTTYPRDINIFGMIQDARLIRRLQKAGKV